ncbi:MAG: 1-(5-phosphoribosyl)-5-[(5-phosphoribosylamino)methylideneamino]imidazole-4-carboxamide isomerase [Planctomycetota bacterium]|jgi:phosphoribosylformimino-5-aminoimidazole carboxamide ribotide isomerase
MIVIPAVDIKGGKCVRLVEGREGTETEFADDPADAARRWIEEGAEYLHIVDLDGAFEGAPRNFEKVTEIIRDSPVGVEFGGGVRETSVVKALIEAGVDRVIVGSALVDNREWAEEMMREFPLGVAVGIDAREGKVAIHGWTEVTDVDAFDLARECEAAGAAAVIYTDISRDGKMEGANLDAMRQMVEMVQIPVVASGGVTTIEDIANLTAAGLNACIIGTALYEGRIGLKEAMEAASFE